MAGVYFDRALLVVLLRLLEPLDRGNTPHKVTQEGALEHVVANAFIHALSTVGRPVAESHEACTTAEWGGEMYRPYRIIVAARENKTINGSILNDELCGKGRKGEHFCV